VRRAFVGVVLLRARTNCGKRWKATRRWQREELMSEMPEKKMKHLDEMTLLLYIERQLDRARGWKCPRTRRNATLAVRCCGRWSAKSRLLTRAMLEEENPFPSRLAQFQERRASPCNGFGDWFSDWRHRSLRTLYAIYPTLADPIGKCGIRRIEPAGLLIFQGAMWKGWQSMITFLEVLAMVTLAD